MDHNDTSTCPAWGIKELRAFFKIAALGLWIGVYGFRIIARTLAFRTDLRHNANWRRSTVLFSWLNENENKPLKNANRYRLKTQDIDLLHSGMREYPLRKIC